MDNPTVFISYSHDNDAHKTWVLKLASDLRRHGVNVIFDQWDLRLGADIRFFMENGLSAAHLVICICSEIYVDKVDSGLGGSGYEGMIMTQPLLNNAKSEHLISVVKNNTSSKRVPLAFMSKLFIDFSDDAQYILNYQKLLERIYGEDSKKKPPLGCSPFSEEMGNKIEVRTKVESVKYHSPEMKGSVNFCFDNNNGLYRIGNGEYFFETRWSRAGNNSIHAYGLIGYKNGDKEFPNQDELAEYDYSSNSRTIRTGQVVVFRNIYNHFVAIKLGEVKSSGHGNSHDEMAFEYRIYRVS